MKNIFSSPAAYTSARLFNCTSARQRCLFLYILLAGGLATAQPGSPDNTFGTGGIVTTDVGSSYDHGFSVAIQTDGKLVVAGDSWNGSNFDFGLVRYNSDGSLDNTFGTGGKVTTSIGSSDDWGYSIAIQTDGKIVVAGSDGFDFALARYHSDGSLDNTFGTAGQVTTSIGAFDDAGNSIAIQTDGKLVVAGISNNASKYEFALARYNIDGSPDNTFGTGGIVTTAIGSSYDYGKSLALQTDGKIVVAGYSYNGSNPDFALLRYNSDGSLDNTFGTGGKVTTSIGSSDDWGYSIAIQTDGKIVVAGYSWKGSDYDFSLVRYNTDGSLDNTFGAGGKVTTPIGSSHDYGNSIAMQADGKLVVAGRSWNGSNDDFALVRYNTDGSLDNTFGAGGKAITAVGAGYDVGFSIAIQTDGKLVVAGQSQVGSTYDFAVVRYNGDIGAGSISSPTNETGLLHLFPNPNQGILKIRAASNDNQPFNVKIYNCLSEIIFHSEFKHSVAEIDLTQNPNGVYFVQVETENGTGTQKLVLNK